MMLESSLDDYLQWSRKLFPRVVMHDQTQIPVLSLRISAHAKYLEPFGQQIG